MYCVYYCAIGTVSENSDPFRDPVHCEAHAEGYAHVQTTGGLVNPRGPWLSPPLQDCPVLGNLPTCLDCFK